MYNIPEEIKKRWRIVSHEKYQNRIGFIGLYDHLNRDCYEAGYLAAKTSSYEREQELIQDIDDLKLIRDNSISYDRFNDLKIKSLNQSKENQKLQERISELEDELKDEIENDTSMFSAKTYIDHLESQIAKRDELIEKIVSRDMITHERGCRNKAIECCCSYFSLIKEVEQLKQEEK